MNCITCGLPFDVVPLEELRMRTPAFSEVGIVTHPVPSKCSRCDYAQDAVTYDKDLVPGQSV